MTKQSKWRFLAPLLVITGLVAAVAFFLGGAPATPHGAEAAGSPTRSVSCADVYQDIMNNTPLGSAHQTDDVPAANSE